VKELNLVIDSKILVVLERKKKIIWLSRSWVEIEAKLKLCFKRSQFLNI